MKKFLCIAISILMLLGSVAHAEENFLYFYSGSMAIDAPIDSNSIAKLGDVYYANDAQGRLMMTQIFGEWLPSATAPANCKVISTKRTDADSLLVYADTVLYVSADGVTFTPVRNFAIDTVLRYNCGMYTAVNYEETGFNLQYSFDGVTWYAFPKTLTASTFSILQVNDTQFALRGMQTTEGKQDVLINTAAPESCTFYTNLVYDLDSDSWLDDPAHSGAALIYASSPATGKYLYIFREEKANNCIYQTIRKENGTIQAWNTLVADKTMQLYVYGEVICLGKNGQSLNLINRGNSWVQVSEDIAFPLIQNAYNLTGDIFFDFGYTSTYYCRNKNNMPIDRSGIEVILNDRYLAFDSEPQIVNDRTMVPVRAIAEALNCTVDFNEETKQIGIVRQDGAALYMTLGAEKATFVWATGESSSIKLDTSPIIMNNRTLVPLRFVCESFDLTTTWIEDTKTIILK